MEVRPKFACRENGDFPIKGEAEPSNEVLKQKQRLTQDLRESQKLQEIEIKVTLLSPWPTSLAGKTDMFLKDLSAFIFRAPRGTCYSTTPGRAATTNIRNTRTLVI